MLWFGLLPRRRAEGVAMEIKLKDSQSSANVNDAAFRQPFNEALVHQAVTAYMAGGRSGTKAQKTRAMVRGGGKKPWRQKGTGRARAGSIRSPLWRSGGKIHAAEPRDHHKKLNKKMYRGALRSIFSELLRQERLHVFDSFTVEAPKTRELVQKLKSLGISDALIVTEQADERLFLAARNLADVDVRDVRHVDPVSLIAFENVVMTRDALTQIEEWLA